MERNSKTSTSFDGSAPTRTRDRLIAILRETPDGLTSANLAGRLGLKRNAVRTHLVSLAALGSVAAELLSGTTLQEFRIAPRTPRCRIVLAPTGAQTGSLQ